MAEEVKTSEAAAQTVATMRQEIREVVERYAKQLAGKTGSTECKLMAMPRIEGTVRFDGGDLSIDDLINILKKGFDPEKVKAWLEYVMNKTALGQRFAHDNVREMDTLTRFISGKSTYDPEQLKAKIEGAKAKNAE